MEESATLNKNGVGLGLSICKNLIELMGGSVGVDSKLGEGTKFTISLKTTCIVNDNPVVLEEAKSQRSPRQSESDGVT
jgi:K+-sensing histidine kinase KdpD